jgi:hypothetical protein
MLGRRRRMRTALGQPRGGLLRCAAQHVQFLPADDVRWSHGMGAGERAWHEVVTVGSGERERSRRLEMAVECSRSYPCRADLRDEHLSCLFSISPSLHLSSSPSLSISLSCPLLSSFPRIWLEALSTRLHINQNPETSNRQNLAPNTLNLHPHTLNSNSSSRLTRQTPPTLSSGGSSAPSPCSCLVPSSASSGALRASVRMI